MREISLNHNGAVKHFYKNQNTKMASGEYTRKMTQDVYVENLNREKPRDPTDSELSL